MMLYTLRIKKLIMIIYTYYKDTPNIPYSQKLSQSLILLFNALQGSI